MKLVHKHHEIRIICGRAVPTMQEMDAHSVDLIATSPPYNCRKAYDSAGDEMPWPEYYAWMGRVLHECYRLLCPGGVLAINVPGVIRYQHDHEFRETWQDFDPTYETHREGEKVLGRGRIEPLGFRLFGMMLDQGFLVREPVVWIKGKDENSVVSTTYQMGSDNNPYMRPCHELILLASKDRWYHRGGTGRRGAEAVPFIDYTKDVWAIVPESDPNHPAVWPVEIPRRLIRLFVHAKDAVVLDPFCGSGRTLRAAHELGVSAIGIDVSQKYCDMAFNSVRQGRLFYGEKL